MIRLLALSLPLISLSACDGSGNNPAPIQNTATPAPDGHYAERIKALAPRLRAGVFLRAVRDGGEACQEVTREYEIAPIDGKPAWAVICDGTNPWIFSVDPTGTAIVRKASTASRLEPRAE